MEPPPMPSLGRFRIRVMVFAPDASHDLKAAPKHSFLVAKGPNLPLQDLTLQQLCDEVLRRFRNMFPREPLFDIQNSQDATGSELYHNDRVGDIFVDNEVFRIVQGSSVRDSLQPFEHRARTQSLRPYECVRPVTPGHNDRSLQYIEHSPFSGQRHQISNLDPDKPVRSCEKDVSEILASWEDTKCAGERVSEKQVASERQENQRLDQYLGDKLPATSVTCQDIHNETHVGSGGRHQGVDQLIGDATSATPVRHRKISTPTPLALESEVSALTKNRELPQEAISKKHGNLEIQDEHTDQALNTRIKATPAGRRYTGTPMSPLLGSRSPQFASTAIIEESDYEPCAKFPKLPTNLNYQGGKQQVSDIIPILADARHSPQNQKLHAPRSASRSRRISILGGSDPNRQHQLTTTASHSPDKFAKVAVEVPDQYFRDCLTPPDSSQQPASDSFMRQTEVDLSSPAGKRIRSPSLSNGSVMSPTKKLKRPVTPKKMTRPPIRMESIYDDIRSDCESIDSLVPARTAIGPGLGGTGIPTGLSYHKMRRATTPGASRSPRCAAQPGKHLSGSRLDMKQVRNSHRSSGSPFNHGRVDDDEATSTLQVQTTPAEITVRKAAVQQASSIRPVGLHVAPAVSEVDIGIEHVMAKPAKTFKPAFTRKSPQKTSSPTKIHPKLRTTLGRIEVVHDARVDNNSDFNMHYPRRQSVAVTNSDISEERASRAAERSIAIPNRLTRGDRVMSHELEISPQQLQQDQGRKYSADLNRMGFNTVNLHCVTDVTENQHHVPKKSTPSKTIGHGKLAVLDLTGDCGLPPEPSSSAVSIEAQMPLPSEIMHRSQKQGFRKPVLVSSVRKNLQQTTLVPVAPCTPDSKNKGKAPVRPNFSDKTVSLLENINLKVENMEPVRVEHPIYISSDCDSVYEPGGFSDIEEIYASPKRARNKVISVVATVKQQNVECHSAKLEDLKPITKSLPLHQAVTTLRQTETISISSDDGNANEAAKRQKRNQKRRAQKDRKAARLASRAASAVVVTALEKPQAATDIVPGDETTELPRSNKGELSGGPMRIVSPIERLAITLDRKDKPADPPQKFFPSSQETAEPVRSVNTYGLPPINVANEIKRFEKRACTDNHSEALDRLYLHMFENEKRHSKLCPEELYSDEERYGRTRHRSGIGYAPSLHRMANAAIKIENLVGPAMEAALHRVMHRNSVQLQDCKPVYESSEESVSDTEMDDSEHSDEEEENDSDLCRQQLNPPSIKTSAPPIRGLGLHRDFLGLLAKCKKNTEARKKQNSRF